MSDRFLPYGGQWITDEDVEAVVDVLRSGWLTTGPTVNRFEAALAQHGDTTHAVAVNSGTAALHCAYFAAGLGPDDEIITSPLTFAATANAALYLGASVKFVDIEKDTGCLDPAKVEAALTSKTRLIVPIDYAGHPADYDNINAIARRHNLTVVSDASHSFGGQLNGKHVGSLADLTTLSFHPVKPITTGEGGAVLTANSDWATRAAMFRTHGVTKDPEKLIDNPGDWHQEMQLLGYNYRLTDLQSALGLSQLKRLNQFRLRRQQITEQYNAAFSELGNVRLPTVRANCKSGWHLYVIRVSPERRKAMYDGLRSRGIGAQVHYIPVHHHPYYQQLGYDTELCPLACEFAASAISLPLFPRMTDSDVSFCIQKTIETARDVL